MGIQGLLPLLKSIHKVVSLRKFEGKTLAVDAYGWLHRGTVACAMELAMGKPTKKFVEFAMHRVRMLQHYGVTPYIVFDGDYLPSKAGTETDRAKRREDSRRAGLDLLKAGKTSQAYLEFQKAVDVTPEMARQLIDELKRAGVLYVVAPYEADAQMVYLERHGIVDGIISEDSDLLVFGAKCLLTKLDQYGNCIEVNKADFCAVKEINLTGWSDAEFRRMTILSGCDYLSSISNMGLKTAYRLVRKHKSIEKIIQMLQFDGKFHVPKGYLEAFNQAELTFLYQRVFCPQLQRIVLHTQPDQPLNGDTMPFIGAYVEPAIAQGVARGDLNPMTKMPITPTSSRSKSAPSTPFGPSSKFPRALSLSSDSKQGKPIDTFFKKRMPLQELDINLFTPSPSQQNALSRNAGPWLATPVIPRPGLTRSSTEPQLPQSMPAPTRVTRNRVSSGASEPRPKRARLCEDDTTSAPGQAVELGGSRFFAPPTEPSPSVSPHGKKRRASKQDVTIYSDDSIEEAMLNLPDFDGTTNKPTKKFVVFQEPKQESIIEDADSQKATTSTSQTSVPALTQSTSLTGSLSPSPTLTQAPNVVPIDRLREKFAFTAGGVSTPKSITMPRDLPTTQFPVPRSRIPVAVHTPAAFTASPFFGSIGSSFTPLARMGAKATNRSKMPPTPPTTPGLTPQPQALQTKSPRRSMLGRDFVPFPEAVLKKRSKVVEPAMVPLPVSDKLETALLGMVGVGGSEDLIVHDSEGEEEDLGLSAGLSPESTKINWMRLCIPLKRT